MIFENETVTMMLALCNLTIQHDIITPSLAFSCNELREYVLQYIYDGNVEDYKNYYDQEISRFYDEQR